MDNQPPQSFQPESASQPGQLPQPPAPIQPITPLAPLSPQPSEPATKRSRRKLWIIIVVSLLILGAATYFVMKRLSSSDYQAAGVNITKVLQKNGKLTDADVARLNLQNYLQASMFAMARQPVQRLIQENDQMDSATTTPDKFGTTQLSDSTYNYATRAFSLNNQIKDVSTPQDLQFNRCVNGKSYSFFDLQPDFGVKSTWQASDSSFDYCDVTNAVAAYFVTDGTNTGGLTEAQATAFLQYVFHTAPKGLYKATSAHLATHDGKQYIKLTAKISRFVVDDDGQSEWNGTQYFEDAFKQTGLNSLTYPYDTAGVPSSERTITMYIDPATTLPAYGEFITDTGVDDKTGQPQPVTNVNTYALLRVQYSFGGQIPTLSTTDVPQSITLSWPAEKR